MEKARFKKFVFEGKELSVDFIQTSQVTDGVECDVYIFSDDNSKDLGIIRVASGCKTPLQKVAKGDRTIEGYLSGKGKLAITDVSGREKIYARENGLAVEVKIGELMQWQADANSDLVVYEICYPPYEEGRFENIF